MISLFKKIFNRQKTLSQEDMKAYLDNRMHEKIRRETEKQIASDDFTADAMDGFDENPGAINDLPEIRARFRSRFRVSNKPFSPRWIILGSVTLIVAVAIIWKNINNFTEQAAVKKTPADTISSDEKFHYPGSIEKISLNTTPVFTSTIETPAPKQEIKNEIKQEPVVPVERIESKGQIVLSLNSNEKNDLQRINRSNVPIDYILDFKVVDYSKRNNAKQNNELNLNPKFENNADKSDNMKNDALLQNVSYIQTLYDMLDNYSRNRFDAAESDCRQILGVFPDDANALFYSALCNYSTGNYEKAIVRLNAVLNGNINTFNEEASWYKALSLLKSGNKQEAAAVLKTIKDEAGFYSQKAFLKLNEINN